MKIYLFIIFSIFGLSFFYKNKNPKITIVISNYSFERSIATSKQYFWNDRPYFDSIEIKSQNLYQIYSDKLNHLQKGITIEFDCRSAIICDDGQGKIDTFYTDPSFYYWRKGNKAYIDSSLFFRKTFRGFLLSNIDRK
jgi:hypothetical protein